MLGHRRGADMNFKADWTMALTQTPLVSCFPHSAVRRGSCGATPPPRP